MILEFKDIYLPLIMAIFLAYIAYQQMKINRNKLKLDLYNKRFEIYSHTLQFQHELVGIELTPETHRKFIEVKQSSIFLFDPKDKIHESLNEMHKKAFKVIGFKEHGSQIKDTPEFIKMGNESQEALSWIMSEIDQLHIKLSKYLNFHK